MRKIIIISFSIIIILNGLFYFLLSRNMDTRLSKLKETESKQEEEINNLKSRSENQNKIIEELNNKVMENSNSLTKKGESAEKEISQLKASANKEKLCNEADILYNTIPPKDENDCGLAFAENIEEMHKGMKDQYEHTPKKCEENYYKKVKKAYDKYIVAKNKCEAL